MVRDVNSWLCFNLNAFQREKENRKCKQYKSVEGDTYMLWLVCCYDITTHLIEISYFLFRQNITIMRTCLLIFNVQGANS